MRKFSVLFLVALMALAAPVAAFDDVPADDPFRGDIDWLADSGITRGCNPPGNTRFCPDDPVTRGAMAAFLVRALGLPSAEAGFDDTTGHTFEGDIASLAAAEITRGCNPPANTRFCPDDAVTRSQMAAFLNRALSGEGPGTPGSAGTIYGHWDGLGGDAYRFDLDADEPDWEMFIQGPAEYSDVVAATNEWVGTTEGAWIEPNVVTFYDLDTQVENESLIWPDSGADPEREIKIHMLAVSDDGQLLAAQVTEFIESPKIEVVRRSDGAILGTGFDETTTFPVTAMEWTPDNSLLLGGWVIDTSDPGASPLPAISIVPASAIAGNAQYETTAEVFMVFTEPGAGAIDWIALSQDATQIVFVERGNIWVADFEPGATPRQLTTGFYPGTGLGKPGWTAQFSPDGTQLAIANQVHQQFIIPNHEGTPINLLLDENEDKYQVGRTLVNYIDAWLP